MSRSARCWSSPSAAGRSWECSWDSPRASEVDEAKLLEPLRLLEPGLPGELVELARWIAAEYCSTFARALNLVLPPGAAKRLSGRKRRVVARPSHRSVGIARAGAPDLTDDQQAVLEPLIEALRCGGARSRLLHGVTGSGKTEIYLRCAAEALEQGRGAIILVPEIALTPQIVARFIERFGETVAVLHSRMTTAQRHQEWRRLREGEARVCVGPRSAVFAPWATWGCSSSTRSTTPPTSTKATPAMTPATLQQSEHPAPGRCCSWEAPPRGPRASGGRRLSSFPTESDGRPLPPVEVLDMRGQRTGLHPETASALAAVRAQGGKAIVLLNRRGWSNFLSCRSCGRVWNCPECDVALVLHRAGGYLACHHCGHREATPSSCPDCASRAVARHGAGTERLAHELAAVFDDGDFPVFRLDADVLASGADGEPGAILSDFQAAPSGVLIGTQMVAKGHDFPDVSLAVVLDADGTLRFPDFRAEERTFALISQLAGRAGRGTNGRVLVQTIAPEARAIRHAAEHDSAGFIADELERREALRYPPFAHLIRIVFSSEDGAPARAAASAVRELLLGSLPPGPSQSAVLGPADLFRLRGRERQVLVVKSAERRPAVAAVGEAVARAAADRAHAEVSFSVDVDPQ